MSSGPSLSVMLQFIFATLPSVLVNVGGIVVASTMLTRYPRPARFVLAGCATNLFAYGLSFFLRTIAISWVGGSGIEMQTYLLIGSLVSSVFYAIGFGLVITAAFIDRIPPQPPQYDD
jgi:hypothetical protein